VAKRDTYKFFLYRLNKEYREGLFASQSAAGRSDDEWIKGTSNNRDSLASNDIKNAAPEAAHNAQAHPYPI
jgi:hypothetical protein